jgi:transitional endoplasmic reticulum ATPase
MISPNTQAPANGDHATGLSPSQAESFNRILHYLDTQPVVAIHGDDGSGRTTLLQRLHHLRGGVLLTMNDFIEAMRGVDPFSLEETFYSLAVEAFRRADLLLIDDLDLLRGILAAGGCGSYPRNDFIEVPLKALADHAASAGKQIVFAASGYLGQCLADRCYTASIPDFTPDDYAALAARFLGPAASAIDVAKVFRFAPKLNAHQLKGACDWVASIGKVHTEAFIDYLRSRRMASNVHLDEVQKVDLQDLKGIDDIIQALEANIVLPLENDQLATELGIKPKRGVLIAGPPGTGKTTVGRALAHRLKGKFFLIDGTCISGTSQFYSRVHRIFEMAKQNSPAVIFIDDSDVIFESGEEHGLYRYLLTMLDGLESESNARVCVMMTAMDVGNLPPALIRSGRVELWLETRLPDAQGRQQILSAALTALPPAMGEVDLPALAQSCEGLTGADLKRLVEDGKILFAYDKSKNLPPRSATDYFLAALTTVRCNNERYAKAESQANARRQQPNKRPPWFDVAVHATNDDD